MLQRLSPQSKDCLIRLIILHLPPTNRSSKAWVESFITSLITYLQLNENDISKYLSEYEIYRNTSSSNNSNGKDQSLEEQSISSSVKNELIGKCIQILEIEIYFNIFLYIEIQAFIVMYDYYDAHGRTLLRNIADILTNNSTDTCKEDRLAIEYHIARIAVDCEKNITDKEIAKLSENRLNRQRNERFYRYAKLGAVSLAAGTIVAVTGQNYDHPIIFTIPLSHVYTYLTYCLHIYTYLRRWSGCPCGGSCSGRHGLVSSGGLIFRRVLF